MVYCRYYSSYFHNIEYTHQNPRLLCDYSQIVLNLGCPCWWEENVIEGCFSALLPNPTSNVYQNFPQCQLANCFAKFWKAYPHFQATPHLQQGFFSTGVHEEWECSTLDYRNWALFMVAHEISHSLFEASFMVRLARQVVGPDWRVNPHDLLVKSCSSRSSGSKVGS